MLHRLYRYTTPLLAPFLGLYLRKRARHGKEELHRLQERYGHASQKRPAGSIIWVHAASVGESISALPLIEKLTTLNENTTILVTTGTVTSAQIMAQRLPEKAIHQYIPLDHHTWIERFLDYWQPHGVIWLESELWPNTLWHIKKRHIPAILVNARLSQKSIQRWKKYPQFAQDILSCFTLILGQNPDMVKHIQKLGMSNVDYVGNLKFASPPLSYNEKELEKMHTMIGDRPLWLIASTHEHEEELIIRVYNQLLLNHPNLLAILVPRHPKRAREVLALIQKHDLITAQRSQNDIIEKETHIYLGDTMGEMGLFYKLSSILTMGGSFVEGKYGGHNIIEPAHLDCAITYGPVTYNHEDSCALFEKSGAAIRVSNENALFKQIDELLNDTQQVLAMQEKAKELANNQLDVINHIIDRLSSLLTFQEEN